MRILIAVTCMALALAMLVGGGDTSAAPQDAPKFTIADVMKKAHGKTGVLNKVKKGQASDTEAKDLLELYQALAKNKPPQGDADSWKNKTTALIEGAKLYVDGKKDDAVAKLNGAANCQACHKIHKG